mgnify:CR=1 FL=1
MKRLAVVVGMAACVSALALWTAPHAHANGPTCGEKGLPDCPLQDWMTKKMDDPLDKGDLKWQVPHGDTPDQVRNHPALRGLSTAARNHARTRWSKAKYRSTVRRFPCRR